MGTVHANGNTFKVSTHGSTGSFHLPGKKQFNFVMYCYLMMFRSVLKKYCSGSFVIGTELGEAVYQEKDVANFQFSLKFVVC